MLEIRAILFDFGKTLIDYNLELIARGLAQVARIAPEDVFYILARDEKRGRTLMDLHERGLIVDENLKTEVKCALIERVIALRGKRGIGIGAIDGLSDEKFWEIWNEMFGPRDPLCETYIKRLRDAGYYLGIISNINPAHKAFVLKRFKLLLDLLHDFTASCDPDVQSRKPEAKIFRVAFSKSGVPPEQTIFVDDMPENVKAVQPFGVHGIVAKTMSQIFADLKYKYGVGVGA
ncbi:MAG: HAD family phosphatase [bacterium]|nr:HAD family phosphatase [bacterium]